MSADYRSNYKPKIDRATAAAHLAILAGGFIALVAAFVSGDWRLLPITYIAWKVSTAC